jgi:hypothetical protein
MEHITSPQIVRGSSAETPGYRQNGQKRMKVAAAPRTRSMVTNRSKLISGVDGRSVVARRFRDLIQEYSQECHGGSADLSPAELGMVRQAAAMTLRAEQLQASVVRGEPVLADELIRLSSEARRILSRLRRRHSQKAPTLSLREHLAAFNKPSSTA